MSAQIAMYYHHLFLNKMFKQVYVKEFWFIDRKSAKNLNKKMLFKTEMYSIHYSKVKVLFIF